MRYLVVVCFFKTENPLIVVGILLISHGARAHARETGTSGRHPRGAARLGTTSLHPSADRVNRLLANFGFPVSRLSQRRPLCESRTPSDPVPSSVSPAIATLHPTRLSRKPGSPWAPRNCPFPGNCPWTHGRPGAAHARPAWSRRSSPVLIEGRSAPIAGLNGFPSSSLGGQYRGRRLLARASQPQETVPCNTTNAECLRPRPVRFRPAPPRTSPRCASPR